MGQVIAITSGKGGVGKTTTTASLGAALASRGKKVLLIDGDVGLRNLDIALGLENDAVYDLYDVQTGVVSAEDADKTVEILNANGEAAYIMGEVKAGIEGVKIW